MKPFVFIFVGIPDPFNFC